MALSVKEYKDLRSKDDLDEIIVEEELRRFNRRMLDYDNSQVGNMSDDKETGRVRMLFGQVNNMSSKPVRAVKVKGLKYLEQKYDTDATFLNEHGCNMTHAPNGTTLHGWMGDEGRGKSVMTYNINDDDEDKSMHQPGGTAISMTGVLSQYWSKLSKDPRNLGR